MGMNEADTRAKLIDPAIHARGWTEDLIKREESAGAIQVVGGKPQKQAKGRIDYTLRIKVNSASQPVAVALIEAKSEDKPATHGLEQVKLYAASKRLNVPFVFSTNGHLFVEYDKFTGLTTAPQPLTNFPDPEVLRARYEKGMGFGLDEPAAKPLLAKYPGGEATRRYYQDAAIRAVFEKLAHCEKTGDDRRALLSLATGAGKTFIAVNLLKRIADAGQLKKALFICDRDELRQQAARALNNMFGSEAQEVGGGKPQKNARILIATYQTLDVDSEEANANFLTTNYPENYFSHIIIDECHRSAWGKWSQVFKLNPNAVQIGLTATPRELDVSAKTKETEADAQITADNIKHFGEPVYEYDMAQGIEDGYLAACEIIQGRVNIDDTGITVDDVWKRKPKDATTGQLLTREELDALYEKTDYEHRIQLPDRVMAMCGDLFNHLLATGGPEQKTIVFCARDSHADRVAIEMNNLYAAWCHQNQKEHLAPYAFKCTAANDGGQYLADLRGSSRHHFIATTVDLLTTGVDVPVVKNIVFFKYVKSPISFYQMVGRGTRLDVPSDKLMFRVYDYTDATRLFGQKFLTKLTAPKKLKVGDDSATGDEEETEQPSVVLVEGFNVHITHAGRFIVTQVDGKAMPVTVEEYKQQLTERLIEEVPTLEAFRSKWIYRTDRRELLAHLPDGGRSASLVRFVSEMNNYDLYDVLAELAYGLNPLTRVDRADAFNYKHAQWLSTLPPNTASTIKALARQFAKGGVEGLENQQIFQTPEVAKAGGLPALKMLGKPVDVLRDTKERMFAV